MTESTLELTVAGSIAEVTLTRPDLLNRFDRALHIDLTETFERLADDRSIRAVLLTSTGRVFSAGGDFALMTASHDDPQHRFESHERGKRLIQSALNLPAPIVVALHADVYGLGATVTLSCDAVVAHRAVRIGDPHVNIGLVAGDGGVVAWPAAAGILRARRQLLTGEPVTATDALTWGLITDLVETPEEVLPLARGICERIASLPPLAVQGTKRSLARLMRARVYEVLDYSFAQQAITSASDDLLEAIAAFKEKRPGIFRGR